VDVTMKSCGGGLVLLGMLTTMPAQAVCRQVPGFVKKEIEMGMGKVIIRRDLAVGSVIESRTFPIPSVANSPNGGERFAECSGSGSMIGTILKGTPVAAMSTTDKPLYTTNVEGVGVRLSRTIGTGANPRVVYYPHTVSAAIGSSGKGDIYFAPVNGFLVELIKTAAKTGNGPLSSGDYTTYYADGDGAGKPVMVTRLGGNATTIISATCEVSANDKNKVVDLFPIAQNKFTHRGFTGGERAFFIRLNCNQGSDGQERRVGLRWDGIYQHPDKLPGVLASTALTRARGVAIQLLSGNVPVSFGKSEQWLPGLSSASGFNVPFVARYYQTGQTVTAGAIQAVARFSVTYE